jgi:hypothetical protein
VKADIKDIRRHLTGDHAVPRSDGAADGNDGGAEPRCPPFGDQDGPGGTQRNPQDLAFFPQDFLHGQLPDLPLILDFPPRHILELLQVGLDQVRLL